MAAISTLISLISLDVCAALVAAGLTAPFSTPAVDALEVVGASNTTPIVLTTPTPHGVPPAGAHVVVTGVGGNAAANNTAYAAAVADDGSITAWLARPVGDNDLALYSVRADGTTVPSAGSGPYTGGGTIQQALVDGQILVGRERETEHSSPPRIVFVPTNSQFGPRSPANRSRVGGQSAAEHLLQTRANPIKTEVKTFEVHVWGVATPPDPLLDFDATEVVYQQIIRSCELLMPGTYELSAGQWADQTGAATALYKRGHEFVFGLEIPTPVVDRILSLVPAGTGFGLTVQIQPADGSAPEVAFTNA